jgi:hypothetical protein
LIITDELADRVGEEVRTSGHPAVLETTGVPFAADCRWGLGCVEAAAVLFNDRPLCNKHAASKLAGRALLLLIDGVVALIEAAGFAEVTV